MSDGRTGDIQVLTSAPVRGSGTRRITSLQSQSDCLNRPGKLNCSTLLFEALVLILSREMPFAVVA